MAYCIAPRTAFLIEPRFMRRAVPPIALDRASTTPFYRQIYERVRDAIARQAFRPGDRLPSARSLANQLGIARGTVDTAYGVLSAEGYVAMRGAAGTVVMPGLKARAIPPREPVTPAPRRVEGGMVYGGVPQPFQMGLPALDAFPRKLWTRLAAQRAREMPTAALTYPDPAGSRELRDAIMRYLAVARGIACAPEQVFLTAGFHGALGLIARVLFRPGDKVWLEDPGFILARRAIETAGACIVPVPVDGEGMDVAQGIKRARGARMAMVTPSHQMPLCVALSLRRRLALLEWAGEAKAWIVEDDYDSEYRYTGRPLPALKSLDRAGRVLYAGTFSKVLFPGLRLAYLVVPERLAGGFARMAAALQPASSALDQAVVADFMQGGHFARHIRRMRVLYAERRLALARALGGTLKDRFTIELGAGGMHLLARLNDRESDQYLVRLAQNHGLSPEALSRMAIKDDCGQGLLLSFTNIPADQAPMTARRLEAALRG
jgi:GntR family transcriptional regulator/MocR family aminotransferase